MKHRRVRAQITLVDMEEPVAKGPVVIVAPALLDTREQIVRGNWTTALQLPASMVEFAPSCQEVAILANVPTASSAITAKLMKTIATVTRASMEELVWILLVHFVANAYPGS